MPQSEEPLIPPTAEEASPPDTMTPDPAAPETVTEAPAAPAGTLPEGWAPVDLATVSPDTLIGADIRTYDGDTVAAVEDVLMSAEGKVESVDTANKVVTVAGENVDGWMPAMTMPYNVDPPAVLATLKPGDQITATVYAGTLNTLYDVKVVPPAK